MGNQLPDIRYSDNVNIIKSGVKKFISGSKVFFFIINAFLEFIIFSVFILVHRWSADYRLAFLTMDCNK